MKKFQESLPKGSDDVEDNQAFGKELRKENMWLSILK